MVDIHESHALADEMVHTIIRFYGTEKNINNEATFITMVSLICFSMVERFDDDAEIMRRFNLMFPIALKEQREFAKTLPPAKRTFKVFEGGKLN